MHDSLTILTIIETTRPDKVIENVFCCGFKHHFEIVNESTGHSNRIHEIEASKRSQTQLVAALDLHDGQEKELLLCYNRTLDPYPLEVPFLTNYNLPSRHLSLPEARR